MDNKDQKKKRKINPINYNLERATNSHALILALVGAYLVFMVYMIVKNYIDGETSMKLSTEIIVVVAMCAGCAICFGYAIYIFYITRNKERIGQEQDREMGYVDEYGNPLDEDGNPIYDEDYLLNEGDGFGEGDVVYAIESSTEESEDHEDEDRPKDSGSEDIFAD